MDPSLLDVLHDSANIKLVAVIEGINVYLYRIIQESINQERVRLVH